MTEQDYRRVLFLMFLLVVVVACMGIYFSQADSSDFPLGATHIKGDMRIARVPAPLFIPSHSALTSWGAGLNKVQLINQG